jgi:hypothetical protein
VSEKGSTLGRGPSLSCERAQRSEGRLILASIRNLNALPTEELASIRTGPSDGRAAPVVARSSHCQRLPPPEKPSIRASTETSGVQSLATSSQPNCGEKECSRMSGTGAP